MKIKKEIKPLLDLIKDEKGKLIFVCILIFVCGLGDLFYGYLNGVAIEAITNKELLKSLLYLGMYFLIEIFLDGVISIAANANLEKIESKLTRRLGLEAYKKTLVLPAVAFEDYSSGKLTSRITNDADTLSFMVGRILRIVVSFFVTFVIFFYILSNSWLVAVEIIVIVFLLAILLKIFNPKMEQTHKERKDINDQFLSLTNESVRGIREIKTLGIRKNLISDATDLIKLIFEKSKKEITVRTKFTICSKLLRTLLEVGVFVTCAFLLYYDKVSLTFFVAMTYYVYRYTWLIEEINDFSEQYQKVKVAIKRVNEIIENRLYSDEKFGDKNINNIEGIIKFENVTFSYPNEKPMLKNFSIELKPGKKIAIVGRSGQGKSTLFNLITRLFNPQKGNIYIDGININELSEDTLRQSISIIRQEPFIFNRSIIDNFKVVNKDIKVKEIKTYCKLAYIDNYISSLPKGYRTIIGEGGVNLSGGQKQRLAIARSLSKNSKIILFDEATSALDNESQEYIKKAIDSLIKDHTIVIVAHRLSTIMDADIIYVVDKGKVIASGKHNQLLKNSEIYKKLYLNENL